MDAISFDRDLDICRKLGRLQGVIASAIIKLEIYALPAVADGYRRDELVEMIATLKAELDRSEIV